MVGEGAPPRLLPAARPQSNLKASPCSRCIVSSGTWPQVTDFKVSPHHYRLWSRAHPLPIHRKLWNHSSLTALLRRFQKFLQTASMFPNILQSSLLLDPKHALPDQSGPCWPAVTTNCNAQGYSSREGIKEN